jgi:hypothetical protein
MPAIRLFDPSLSTGGQAADVIAQYLSHMDVRAEAGLIQPEAAYRARHYCTSFAADIGAIDVADCRRRTRHRRLPGCCAFGLWPALELRRRVAGC